MYLNERLTPDMQSRIALGMGGSGGGRPKCVSPDGRPCGRLGQAELEKLARAVKLVDVLAPMERYEELLLYITREVPWPARRF